MKRKLLVLLLTTSVACSLVGCSGKGKDVNDSTFKDVISAPDADSSVEDDSSSDSVPPIRDEEHVHSYFDSVSLEPTCSSEGTLISSCECGDSFSSSIPSLSHDYVESVTSPSCLENGFSTFVCSRCGDSYVANELDALGHSFLNYSFNNDATYTSDGTETALCERCDATDTRLLEGSMLSYSFSDLNAVMYAGDSANVRDLPSKDGKKLGKLPKDSEVSVSGKCNETGWFRIDYNGSVGFVSNKQLSSSAPKKEEVQPAPTQTPPVTLEPQPAPVTPSSPEVPSTPSTPSTPAPTPTPTPSTPSSPSGEVCTHAVLIDNPITYYHEPLAGGCSRGTGLFEKECAHCGYIVPNSEFIRPTSDIHDTVIIDEGIIPTCTTPGKHSTTSCSCGHRYNEGAYIPPHGHMMWSGYTGEVSDDGMTMRWIEKCIRCEMITKDEWVRPQ